ncbi:hypothetical protein LZ32DRAFT_600215 [Colletotrichum eremochloae]|nr:hypothetical protein LZ32DRAFT_600215 [Colletotrichum eremochloae]
MAAVRPVQCRRPFLFLRPHATLPPSACAEHRISRLQTLKFPIEGYDAIVGKRKFCISQ